jgi:EAL domain-containing protein (putative c-di-GMP-specific phosphodiesterase class I)
MPAEQVPEITPSDFVGVYLKLRTALEPARTYSISMHDEAGEAEWLSESSLGPDEHRAVVDALGLFEAEPERRLVVQDLGGARSALMLRVGNYERALLGTVMLVVDSRTARHLEGHVDELMTLSVQRALHQYAKIREMQRARHAPRQVPTADPAPPGVAGEAQAKVAAPAVDGPAAPASSRAGREVDPELDRLSDALRNSPIELHVQRLVPLHQETERRRYEVLLRSKASLMQNAAPRTMLKTAIANGLGSMIDRRVLTELVGWLTRHPNTWQVHGLSFSVNLTRTSLHDPNFLRFIDLCIAKAGLARGTIGFEVDVPTALRAGERMTIVAAALQGLGCPLVLDDFTTDSECVDLVLLPGISMLKVAGTVTAKSRTDRIAQAAIGALVQRARAQKILTVAKRIRSRADEQWLSDVGFDFVQSHAFSLPVTIASLVKRFGINPTQA